MTHNQPTQHPRITYPKLWVHLGNSGQFAPREDNPLYGRYVVQHTIPYLWCKHHWKQLVCVPDIYRQPRNVSSDIFESALEIPKRISMIQPRTMVCKNNTVSSLGSPRTSNWILKRTERRMYVHCKRPSVGFTQAFLVGYTSSHNDIMSISMLDS